MISGRFSFNSLMLSAVKSLRKYVREFGAFRTNLINAFCGISGQFLIDTRSNAWQHLKNKKDVGNELLSPSSRLDARPARKPTPTAISPTPISGEAVYSPMQVKQSTGTFYLLDIARKVISELMHKHHLII